MGRTVPSFRYVLASEKSEWKPFRDALDKKEKREFDDMWDIARLYISACSNSVQLVPLHPIIMSILFHHYKELLQCIRETEELGAKVDAKEDIIIINDMKYSTISNKEEKEEEDEKEAEKMQEIPITTITISLDGFPTENNKI